GAKIAMPRDATAAGAIIGTAAAATAGAATSAT
ncbi:MAG: hypothetical protein QOF09_2600, partial [Alphaproteobacteria bacterium]|nr:hypothetical protein [Alphaproteobacteria bacterium]